MVSPQRMVDILPGVYQAFFAPNILKVNVTETKATCHNCLRARDRRFAYTYKSHLKCCTFHPFTPNYAVGGVLLNQNLQLAQDIMLTKIKTDEFSLPIGLMAPFDYQFKFLTREEEEFGNNPDLLCPYYDKSQQGCGMWEYRGVVCTTFYCRSDDGQNGQKFWAVLSDYLSYVEMALAEECLVQLDFSPRDLSDQLLYLNKREFEPDEINQKKINVKEAKSLWNGYSDRADFYKKCFLIVKNIDRPQFKTIIGKQGLHLEEEVLDYAHRR